MDTRQSTKTSRSILTIVEDPEALARHVPRLYTRASATETQKASVLLICNSYNDSAQLAREFPPEDLIDEFIKGIMGGLSHSWKFLSYSG